jgi:hypothetical protein
MDSPSIIRFQPPFYVLSQGGPSGGIEWITRNQSMTVWFTSKSAADGFLLRNSDLPGRANWLVLHEWADVLAVMEELAEKQFQYMLLDPVDATERQLWMVDILAQLRKVKPRGMAAVEVRDRLIFELDIYCDESGHAPVNDFDDILIVSAVVVRGGRISELPTGRYKNVRRTVEYIGKNRLRHSSFIVKPRPGYGTALDKKIQDYKHVADKNREMGRPNLVFSSSEQIRHNHYVWFFAMQSIINWLIPDIAKQGNIFIEKVRVFLNQINQTEEMRRFFKQFLAFDGPQSTLNSLKAQVDDPFSPNKNRQLAMKWGYKFRIKNRGDITAQFDNEDPFLGDKGFLRLADRVAHHTFRQLRNQNPKPELYDALKSAGIEPEEPLDITASVMRHYPKMVEEWEQKTGQRP